MSSTRVVAIVVGIVVLVGAAAGVGILLARDGDAAARGDLIVYSCKEPPRNAWYAICTMKIDGSEKRRLTSRVSTSDPAWSPDGRRIAFTRNEDVGESTTFTDDDVFVMDGDGDDLRQLTPEQDGQMSGQPTWSPDGREIAFLRGRSVASVVPSRFGDLFVMSADGGDIRLLARGPANAPAWSPDGQEIAFARGERLSSPSANIDIYVVDATGGEPRPLIRSASFDETAPAWSPDGSRILFARSTFQTEFDGKAAIHVVDRDGTGEKLVLENQLFASYAGSLSWSPDGRTIAFETSPTIGCVEVALVPAEGGPVRRLTSCTKPREIALAPAWQPAVATGER
jgi:TolB protein